MRRFRRLAGFIFLIGCMTLLTIVSGNGWVRRSTQGRIFTSVETTPAAPVAMVFGAGITANRTPTAALADRIMGGVLLYRAGVVRHLLMTGDNSRVDYDEVTVMREWAIARGVPAEAITVDYAGFRTYDSCYRAQAIFGIERAVLVTQAYHLPRALYTCQARGIEAVGLAADSIPNNRRSAYQYLLPSYQFREQLATTLMLWETHITKPKPRFLGPPEPLDAALTGE